MQTQEMRELDAEIAVKVFGWRQHCDVKKYAHGVTHGPAMWLDEDGKLQRFTAEFHPTTDAAAAMEVLRKFLANYSIELGKVVGSEVYRSRWHCNKRLEFRTVDAPTLELCIAQTARELFSK